MAPFQLRRRVNAVVIKLWSSDPPAVAEQLHEQVLRHPLGLHMFDPSTVAVTVAPGDPDVVEAACRTVRQLYLHLPASIQVRALIFPSPISAEGDRLTPAEDELWRDLETAPPDLPARSIQLTGHAVRELESRWLTRATLEYTGPSGRSRSVWTLTEASRALSPWRNLEVLRRRPPTVLRSASAEVRQLLNEPACWVHGPLGSGKSRTIADQITTTGQPVFWTSCWSRRSGGPSIAHELLSALVSQPDTPPEVAAFAQPHRTSLASWWAPTDLSATATSISELTHALFQALDHLPANRPIHLVVDDVHRIEADDLTTVEELLHHPRLGNGFQLHLIGRPGASNPDSITGLPGIELGPLSHAEIQLLWQQLADGLSIPDAVAADFAEACLGYPFALEEGLLQLVRRRMLRQLYGNFFFSGEETTAYEPTARLVRHVEAETLRLGTPMGARVLAVAGRPLTEFLVSNVLRGLEVPIEAEAQQLEEGGLARSVETPLGDAYDLSCPAYARALSTGLEELSLKQIRHDIALALQKSDSRRGGSGSWERYELLVGTEDAVPVLLQAARASGAEARSEQLFRALRSEIERLGGEDATRDEELELLWAFLPLARRLGQLRNLDSVISRAMELSRDDPRRHFAFVLLKVDQLMLAGDLRGAEVLLLDTLRHATGLDAARQSVLISHLGKLLQRQERFDEALGLYNDLLARVEHRNATLSAACHFHLGNIAMQQGRLHDALRHHKEALDLRRQKGPALPIGHSLTALGSLNLALGNLQRADSLFDEAMELFEHEQADHEFAFPLLGKARICAQLGNTANAVNLARRSLQLRADTDDRVGAALAGLALAEYLHSQGSYEAALNEARRVHFTLSLQSVIRQLGNTERLLGRIHHSQRNLREARERLETALDLHIGHGYQVDALFDRGHLMTCAVDSGDIADVERHAMILLDQLQSGAYPEWGETLDLQLYRSLTWLRQQGRDLGDPLPPLERGYAELCRRTELLEPEQRNTFLMQVPDNRDLLTAAAHHGLATVSL